MLKKNRLMQNNRKAIPVQVQPANVYNNCTFGYPFPILVPQQQQQQPKTVTVKQVIEYVVSKTNFNVEMVERVVLLGQDFIASGGKGLPDDEII